MMESSERKSADPRYCQTHALVSKLFANSTTDPVNAEAWSYNARIWAQLAELRQRVDYSERVRRPYRRDPS
jgi:hypothetical protein